MAKSAKKAPNVNAENVADALEQLASTIPASKEKSKPGDWEMQLSDPEQELLDLWIQAHLVQHLSEEQLKVRRAELIPLLQNLFLQRVWAVKNQPSNPNIRVYRQHNGRKIVDSEAKFQFKDQLSVEKPAKLGDKDNFSKAEVAPHLVEALVENGLSHENASNLVENELLCETGMAIDLSELVTGRYGKKREWFESSSAEKAVGAKIVGFLKGQKIEPLTQAEIDLAVSRFKTKIRVKQGFLSRVCDYCDKAEDLYAIFLLIKPTLVLSNAEFAKSDTANVQNDRKMEAAAKILGVTWSPKEGVLQA